MAQTVDERIEGLLDQLEITTLTESEIEMINRKIAILKSQKE